MIASGAPVVRHVQVGVDVGKMADPTTIVVSDLSRRATQYFRPGYVPGGEVAGQWFGPQYSDQAVAVFDTLYNVRHMEQLPLGTSYPEQARRLVTVLRNLAKMRLPGEPLLERSVYFDITGVGRPVYDLVVEYLQFEPLSHKVPVYGITFSSGDETVYDLEAGRCSKAHLASRLQALLQENCILLPADHPDAPVVREQLKKYEIRASARGAKTGAFENESHDDYPTAIGLSALEDPYKLMAGYGPGLWS